METTATTETATTGKRANEPVAGAVRLAFVDDHPTLLKGLASLFPEEDGFSIVGTGATASAVETIAATCQPDVVVTDLSMPGSIFDAIRNVTRGPRAPKIVIFTAYDDTDLAVKAMRAGAQAFVLKGAPSDELFAAIRAVLQDELYISPGFTEKLIAAMRSKVNEVEPEPRLSRRERQIVDCLLEGKTNKEIARSLDLTEKTIKHYMTNLMLKLGVRNRVEVVLAVRRRDQDGGTAQQPALSLN